MALCILCEKGSVAGRNVPKSVHKTNRLLRPNLQKYRGISICTRCARTLKKYQAA